MARKGKGTEGKTGDGVLDLRYTGATVSVVVWRKAKATASSLLQIEGNI